MKIDIVIMASGESRRFGIDNKLLCDVNGRPMFEYAIKNAVLLKNRLNCIDRIIVVSRFYEIETFCKKYDVIYAENNESDKGITNSIRIGLKNSNKNNALMFMVSDQPYLKYSTLEDFVKRYIGSDFSIACVSSNSIPANPCIFSSKWRKGLSELTGDKGGKSIIKKHINDVYLYNVKDSIEIKDIDEKTDIFNFPFLKDKGHIISFVGAGGKTTLMYAISDMFNNMGHKTLVTTTTHIMKPEKYVSNVSDAVKLWAENNVVIAGKAVNNKLSMPDNIYEFILEADTVLIESDGAKMLPLKVPSEKEPVILPESDIVIGVVGLDSIGKTINEICFRKEEACKLLCVTSEHIINEEDIALILSSKEGTMKNVGSREYYVILNKCNNERLRESAYKIKRMLNLKGIKNIYIFGKEVYNVK